MFAIPMKKYKDQMLEMLSGLVGIPSVKGESEPNMPYGRSVFKALMYMLDQAERLDLESVNLFGHMGYATYGSGEQTFGILTHIDVVPAGEGWETDPFQAVIKDGKVYGRGTVDDKGAAVAALFALHAVKTSCIGLNKQVKVFFGCDEESGWGDIEYYKAHYPEIDYVISPDAFFPIINREKGLLQLEASCPAEIREEGTAILAISAGTRANIVPNLARCTLRAPLGTVREMAAVFGEGLPAKLTVSGQDGKVDVECRGRAAHGAHPEQGVNALAYLSAFLNVLPLADGRAEKFIYTLAELIGTDTDGRGLGIDGSDDLSGSLTLNLGAIEMAEGRIAAKLDIRFPVSMETQDIWEKIQEKFRSRGMDVRILHSMPPHYVPEDSTLIQTLKEVYRDHFGEEAACMACSGATYARAFRNSVAFGPVSLGSPSVEHGPNEYMKIDDLLKLAEVLADTILRLAAAPGECESLL